MTSIHTFTDAAGVEFGCGTEAELQHWQNEGVIPKDVTLGAVIGHEPASEDARRRSAWARGKA